MMDYDALREVMKDDAETMWAMMDYDALREVMKDDAETMMGYDGL